MHIENKLCIPMAICSGICGNPVGCPGDKPKENLALRCGQVPGELNDRIQCPVTELCKIVGFPIVSRTRRQQRVKGLLPLRVGLGTDVFTMRIAETCARAR